jgi:hypothetical protein
MPHGIFKAFAAGAAGRAYTELSSQKVCRYIKNQEKLVRS